MGKKEIAERLARQAHLSPGDAADQLDRLVYEILQQVRKGHNATIPGLGTFRAGDVLGFDLKGSRKGKKQ